MYVKPLTEAEQDEKRIIAEITKKSALELRIIFKLKYISNSKT